jgi:glutaminyl-peptide cyclotransferase
MHSYPPALARRLLARFLLLMVAPCLGLVGCQQAPAEPDVSKGPAASATQVTHVQVADVKATDGNADSAPASHATPARLVSNRQRTNPLDADRAMGYLSHMANIGPRYSGSAGMQTQRKYLSDFFTQQGAKVTEQKFPLANPLGRRNIEGVNMLIEWHPERRDRVLVCAHYDTRPLPDYDPDPSRRQNGVFIGANDGASGVAVLMELAHHLKTIDSKLGIDFVLFDAEDYVYEAPNRRYGEYCKGSEHFARDYRKSRSKEVHYHWGVLLDMVGDAQLEIRQEQQSLRWRDTRPLVQQIWQIAAELGVDEFVPRTTKTDIYDDHVPLHDIGGISVCNIIDAMYPNVSFGEPGSYWHTEQDVPANCSGESLAKVGWVVLEWLGRAKAQ